jgi:hypothetical protein
VPYEWTIGWHINTSVVRILKSDGAQRSNETMHETVRALNELHEAGLVERRHTGTFTEWRRKA